MKRRFALLFLLLFLILLLPVSADFGPKESVRVSIEGLDGRRCFGTLLSERDSTGPQSVWDGKEEHIYLDGLDMDIWRAFAGYEDADGYYFLQIGWDVSESAEIAWKYYPPYRFKILLYFPDEGCFAVSDICEKYAFDTYYTVRVDGDAITSAEYDGDKSTDARLEAWRSYRYKQELISLGWRILLTILVEMAIGLAFGFRKKKALLVLIAVNTVTQILLNIALNVINFHAGEWAFVFFYVLLEMAVFIIEAILYSVTLRRMSEPARPVRFYVGYAFLANAVSFVVGLILAHVIPGIF